jgi:hypothetical protein
MDFILCLYQSKNTVFTIDEIAMLFGEDERKNLKSKINYYVKKGNLKNIRKGIYSKIDYDPLELATKIYTPSYISLETVLEREGIIFQKYETIFVVSYLSRKIEVDGHKIQYRRIKEEILINDKGVNQRENYAIAIKERAFLDIIYLYKDYYFNNLDVLGRDIISQLINIYRSKALNNKVKEIIKNA